MAIRWKTAAGNWSDITKNNGGTAFDPNDEVYLNGFSQTVDVPEINVALVSNRANAGAGIAAGGSLTASGATIASLTLRCNMECSTVNLLNVAGVCLPVTHEAGYTLSPSNTTGSRYTISFAPTSGTPADLTLKGTYQTGAISGANAVNFAPSGLWGCRLVFVEGCQLHGIGGLAAAVQTGGVAPSEVTGVITRILATGSAGVHPLLIAGSGNTGTVTIRLIEFGPGYAAIYSSGANVIAIVEAVTQLATPAASGSIGFFQNTGGEFDVTAPSFTVPSVTNLVWALANNSTSRMKYRGNLVCGFGTNNYTFRASVNGAQLEHFGKLTGGASGAFTTAQITTVSGAKITLDEIAAGAGGLPSIDAGTRLKSTSIIRAKTVTETDLVFVSSTNVGDPPDVEDVRAETRYHFDTLEGTLAVPLASQTVAGVPVDDTIGTAVLTVEGIASAVVVSPLQATLPERENGDAMRIFVGETCAFGPVGITDTDGSAVDLSGKNLRLIIERDDGTNAAVLTDADLDVSGSSNNQITFDIPSAASEVPTNAWTWSLEDVDDGGRILSHGPWIVKRVPRVDP